MAEYHLQEPDISHKVRPQETKGHNYLNAKTNSSEQKRCHLFNLGKHRCKPTKMKPSVQRLQALTSLEQTWHYRWAAGCQTGPFVNGADVAYLFFFYGLRALLR